MLLPPIGAMTTCWATIFQRVVALRRPSSSQAICVSPRIRRGRPSRSPVRYWRSSSSHRLAVLPKRIRL
jgi:hypothetical protein